MSSKIISCLLALALIGTAASASAQTRSDTGRRKAPEVEARVALADTMPTPPPSPGWFMGMTGGVASGSDLFAVDVPSGVPLPWGVFNSESFNVALSSSAEFGVFLGKRLGDRFSVRGDLAWSPMDVVAEASVGQVGAVFTFDQWSILTVAAGLEMRLVRNASHPFLGVGVMAQRLSPSDLDDLAQTNLGVRLALGYQHVLDDQWSLRLEGRLNRTGFGMGDYEPRPTGGTEVEIDLAGESELTTWSLLLGVQLELSTR